MTVRVTTQRLLEDPRDEPSAKPLDLPSLPLQAQDLKEPYGGGPNLHAGGRRRWTRARACERTYIIT